MICKDLEQLFERAYESIRGGLLIRIYKARDKAFLEDLLSFVERMDKSITSKLLLDLTRVEVLNEVELNGLIKMKRELESKYISLTIIVRPLAKSIINLFEAIQQVEDFPIFYCEQDAVLNI